MDCGSLLTPNICVALHCQSCHTSADVEAARFNSSIERVCVILHSYELGIPTANYRQHPFLYNCDQKGNMKFELTLEP